MTHRPTPFTFLAALLLLTPTAPADTLKVGPNEKYTKIAPALDAAHDNDTIEIAPGSYPGDVATIHANGLTIRSAGPDRIKIPANGKNAAGKAIWVVAGHDTTIENIEFSGARVPDHNGAAIRAEGPNLTIRHCRFFDCEDGILGGNGDILIEYSEFAHCGPVADPATHSLYISANCSKLTFQYNYSTDVIQGHLLKSRAKQSFLLYNRLSDESGTGSAVADFPNGGYVVLLGNVLQKGKNAQNTRVIAYGMEGIKHQINALFVVHNTMIYENHRGGAFFINAPKVPDNFTPVIRNNLCIGKIPLTNCPNKPDDQGNLLLQTLDEAKFVDPAKYNYHLAKDSPAIDHAAPPGKAGDFDLTPKFQYVHLSQMEKRPTSGPLDIGAFEFTPHTP